MRKTTTEKGSEFEAQVASLYRSAGFDIRQNFSVSGSDLDLLCTKEVAPHIGVSIVVECKFKSGREKVGPLDVEKFANKLKYARDHHNITHGVIICNNGFTPAAQATASQSGVTLRSLDELEDDLLGFAAKFVISQRKYKASDIFQEYFGLEGQDRDQQNILDIDEFVFGELNSFGLTAKRFFVLGDFGAGKTTLVNRINYRLQDQYLRDRRKRIPVIFRLNRLLVENDLSRFVENQIKSELGLDLGAEAFFALLASGRIVLFLDGLDEIESHSDEQAKINNIAKLSPFFNSNSALVITTRPTMFRSRAEMAGFFSYIEEHESIASVFDNAKLARASLQASIERLRVIVGRHAGETLSKHRLENSELITIRPLSKDAVVSVLRSKKNILERSQTMAIEDIVRELFNIYDLSDLMSRPFLLFMVIDVLKVHKIKEMIDQNSISSAVLYSIYIESYLKRDWDKGKGRQFLAPTERRMFSQSMALSMLYKAGRLAATLSEIIPVLKRVMKERMDAVRRQEIETNIQSVVSDILLCAFLRLSGEEMFEFVHKSFMEYFSAEYIATELVKAPENQLINELNYELNQEILQFVGGLSTAFDRLNSRLIAQLEFSLPSGANIYRRNLGAALVYSNRDVNISLVDLNISDCNFRRKTIRHSLFDGVGFLNRAFSEVNIAASEVRELEFRDCNLTKCRISKIAGSFSLSKVICDGVSLSEAKVAWRTTAFKNGTIEGCEIRFDTHVDDGTQVLSTTIAGSTLAVANRVSENNDFTDVRLSNSTIVQLGSAVAFGSEITLLKNPQLSFKNCDLNCLIFFYPVLMLDLTSLESLAGCSGILFTSLLSLSKDGSAALLKPDATVNRALSPFFRLYLEKGNQILVVNTDSDESFHFLRRLIEFAGTTDPQAVVRILSSHRNWMP